MRTNIIVMLDHIVIQEILRIKSCASLFAERIDLVHCTSALRYPVFKHELTIAVTRTWSIWIIPGNKVSNILARRLHN